MIGWLRAKKNGLSKGQRSYWRNEVKEYLWEKGIMVGDVEDFPQGLCINGRFYYVYGHKSPQERLWQLYFSSLDKMVDDNREWNLLCVFHDKDKFELYAKSISDLNNFIEGIDENKIGKADNWIVRKQPGGRKYYEIKKEAFGDVKKVEDL